MNPRTPKPIVTVRRLAAAAVIAIAVVGSGPALAPPVEAAPLAAKRVCPPFCRPTTPTAPGRFVYIADAGWRTEVFRWDAGTPAPVQLTVGDGGSAKSPVWSPDGTAIAFLERMLIPTTKLEWPDYVHDRIVIIDPDGVELASYVSLDGYMHRDYLSWSNDGEKLCFTDYYKDWGSRGLRCLVIPTNGGAYNWSASMSSPDVMEILPNGSTDALGLKIAPTELAFAVDDSAIYFSADTPETRGRLYRIGVGASGPIGAAQRVLDDVNGTIDLAFAPSVGMQNGAPSLLFNSECWRDDPSCKDEELMRLDLATGQIKRLSNAPGNTYASYGRGAGGGYVVQVSTSAGGPSNLAAANAADKFMLMPLLMGHAPDWWVE